MTPLAARRVTHSVVSPTIRVPSHPGKLLMGVFDAAGTYVEGTVLDRRSGEQGAPVPAGLFAPPTDAPEPEAIYAGPLYFHFGHFLLESLARAWFARQHPEVPFVWAGAHTWQDIELRPWQTEILEVLGITNPVQIVAAPTRFPVLHVPDLGYRYDDRFHPEHAEFLACYDGPEQVEGRRLWLSRSKVSNDARDLNAPATERRLAASGWTIAHPETLSVREQLDELCRAEVVAGEEGSAFHSLVLLRDVSTKRLEILRRHGKEHRNMHTVGDARRLTQTFHTLANERVLHAEGRVVSKINPRSSEILDVLGVPVPPPPAPDEGRDDRVLAQALAELRPGRLLDVGARDAALVVGSAAATRVAVSPSFDLDPRSYAGSGVEFYELALDGYADHFHDRRGRFDVLRITGATLEDVMASFVTSKGLARPDATWLLGTDEVAARAAVAIHLLHPGYTARRLVVRRRVVYVAQRVPGAPRSGAAVATMPGDEVARRARRLPLVRPRLLARRRAAAPDQP